MTRKHRVWAVPAVGLVFLAAGWTAVAQEKSTSEKIKEKAGAIGASIKRGALSAEEAIKRQYNLAKEAVVKMGVEGRVYARLHWDKALSDSKIELSAPKSGVIKLSGTVSDPKAKAKAVELTTDTVGVNEVVDDLTVQSTAAPAPSPAARREPK
jgi:osmotically-inducible protein OsmY